MDAPPGNDAAPLAELISLYWRAARAEQRRQARERRTEPPTGSYHDSTSHPPSPAR